MVCIKFMRWLQLLHLQDLLSSESNCAGRVFTGDGCIQRKETAALLRGQQGQMNCAFYEVHLLEYKVHPAALTLLI